MKPKEIRVGNALLQVYRPNLAKQDYEKHKDSLAKSLLRFGMIMEREKKDEKKET